jgi:predicted amidohydrolase
VIHQTYVREAPPARGEGIRLAIFQATRPVGSEVAIQENLARLEDAVQKAARLGAQLMCFPELYVEGYSMTPDVAHRLAERVDGPSITRVREIAEANGIAIVCPYAEKDESTGEALYYDSIAFVGAGGEMLHNYRKTHLFGMAERVNWSFGYTGADKQDAYRVGEVNGLAVGVLNCYEAEFPELSRILALKGAKLICIPTAADYYYNLADGKRTKVPYPDISKNLIPAHAYENDCFVCYCNRSGSERVGAGTWQYRGNSIICGPHGDVILAARNVDTLLLADCIPADYGPTHPEGHYLRNRRPELYGELVAMHVDFDGGTTYQDPPKRDSDL